MVIVLGVMLVIGGGLFLLLTAENRTRRPQRSGPGTAVEPQKERADDPD